jgi:hypothetical protein
LHAIDEVGGAVSPMTSHIVRAYVPLAERGASQARNALRMAGLTEDPPLGSQPSQTWWNKSTTQPPPAFSARVTAPSTSASVFDARTPPAAISQVFRGGIGSATTSLQFGGINPTVQSPQALRADL